MFRPRGRILIALRTTHVRLFKLRYVSQLAIVTSMEYRTYAQVRHLVNVAGTLLRNLKRFASQSQFALASIKPALKEPKQR